MGDTGMRWQPSNGPRMQFLSRNLCAKAGPAEMSVLPMAGDTCAPPSLPAGMLPGRGQVRRVYASDCCQACLAEWWCRAWTEPLPGVCSLKDNALPSQLRRVHSTETTPASGVRRYMPAQVLPSPRYANCIVNGVQTIEHTDNAARAPAGEDDEWFAVVKEQSLGARCEKPAAADVQIGGSGASTNRSSYFWSVMTTNENGWANLGTDAECLPQCYHSGDQQRAAGWPPAVNASGSLCPDGRASPRSGSTRQQLNLNQPLASSSGRTFSGNPMNQPKVLVHLTEPGDPHLRGSFNWTFEYDANLAVVPPSAFPRNQSWGKAEWWRDASTGIGHVRLFSQTSTMYPWTCTYFSADAGVGVKANQLYDGRGMMTEAPHPPDFIVRYFLEVSAPAPATGMYAPNMVACWSALTGAPCRPYDDTNAVIHQQILFNMGKNSTPCGNPTSNLGCPRHHVRCYLTVCLACLSSIQFNLYRLVHTLIVLAYASLSLLSLLSRLLAPEVSKRHSRQPTGSILPFRCLFGLLLPVRYVQTLWYRRHLLRPILQ